MMGKMIAFKAIELIREQIDEGIDADGKPYAYSTKPFAKPYGKLTKKLERMLKKEPDRLGIIKRNGGNWLVVKKGYKDWRELNNRSSDGDFLQWTGQLLRSMSARAEGENVGVVYFTDAAMAERAFWMNVSGVGRGRKLWKFLGLTKANEQKLAEWAKEKFAAEIDLTKIIQFD